MEGYGVMTWKDGKKYEGEYVNDKMEGAGVLYEPGIGIFHGSWMKGKKNGEG
jgi:hypothetical protein